MLQRWVALRPQPWAPPAAMLKRLEPSAQLGEQHLQMVVSALRVALVLLVQLVLLEPLAPQEALAQPVALVLLAALAQQELLAMALLQAQLHLAAWVRQVLRTWPIPPQTHSAATAAISAMAVSSAAALSWQLPRLQQRQALVLLVEAEAALARTWPHRRLHC